MGVGQCGSCGTYFEGDTCSVCHRDRDVVVDTARRPSGSRPWELAGTDEDVAPRRSDDSEAPWKPTNPWAIAALTLGLLGGSILAIIFGRIALRQIDEHGRESGAVPAVVGIVLGSVWLVGIVILVIVRLSGS